MLLRHLVIPLFHKGMLREFGDLLRPLWVLDKAGQGMWGCEFPAWKGQQPWGSLAALGPALPSLTLPECFPGFHPDTEASHVICWVRLQCRVQPVCRSEQWPVKGRNLRVNCVRAGSQPCWVLQAELMCRDSSNLSLEKREFFHLL